MNNKIDVDYLISETEKFKKWAGITPNAVKEFMHILIIKYYKENSIPKEEK